MPESRELTMHLGDPDEDVVGGLLLLLTRRVLDHRKPERLAELDRHPGKRSRFQLRTW